MELTTLNKWKFIVINVNGNNSKEFSNFLINKLIDNDTYHFNSFPFSSADKFKEYIVQKKPKRILIDKYDLRELFTNERNELFRVKKEKLLLNTLKFNSKQLIIYNSFFGILSEFLYYEADLVVIISPDNYDIAKIHENKKKINFFDFCQNQFKRKQKIEYIFNGKTG